MTCTATQHCNEKNYINDVDRQQAPNIQRNDEAINGLLHKMVSSRTFAIIAAITTFALAASTENRDEGCMHDNTIRVISAGKGTYRTTLANVRLAVEAKGGSQPAVQATIAKYAGVLTQYLNGRGAKQLTTGTAHFQRSPRGAFMGALHIGFVTNVKGANELLEGALQNGAASVKGVKLIGEPEDVAVARDDAVKNAVKQARIEADSAAEMAEVEVIAPDTVDVTNMFIPRPIVVGNARAGHSVLPNLHFVPEEQEATALVQVKFKTADMYMYEEAGDEGAEEEDFEDAGEKGELEGEGEYEEDVGEGEELEGELEEEGVDEDALGDEDLGEEDLGDEHLDDEHLDDEEYLE